MFIEETIDQIINSKFKSIITNGDDMITSNKRGVAPILDLTDGDFLNGAIAYDSVIGKAAAMLLVNYKVCGIFAAVISQYACDFLDNHNVCYKYIEKVPYIINRTKDGMCPLENEVLHLDSESEAEEKIRARIKILMSK